VSLTAERMCQNCQHFADSAAAIETAMPGLSSLGSAYAAVRSEDGICHVHGRYLAASSVCSSHATRLPHYS
jgi:hypothetical protein